MKVTHSPTPEFWNWLVQAGWREVQMTKNRRKYAAVPTGAFAKLAKASTQEREAQSQRMLARISAGKKITAPTRLAPMQGDSSRHR